jgi:hypothetical protein
MKSEAQIVFTMKFNIALPEAAGAVKLFMSNAAGEPVQLLADMQPSGADSSAYTATLALQGLQLGSFSSRPGKLWFTVAVGTAAKGTGAVSLLEVLVGKLPIKTQSLLSITNHPDW